MSMNKNRILFFFTIFFLVGCASQENQVVTAVSGNCGHLGELPGKNVSYFVTSLTAHNDTGNKTSLVQRGMGVAVGSTGKECLILTNKHFTSETDTIWVQPWTGTPQEEEVHESTLKARMLFEDPDSDIALLAFSAPDGCITTEVAETDAPLGNDIIVFGQPLISTGFVSKGIISGTWMTDMGQLLVSDVFTTKGFSGSGAFTYNNKLVGLVIGKTTDKRPGFAYIIPVSGVKGMLTTVENGKELGGFTLEGVESREVSRKEIKK